jgi:hypothetical protein
MWEDSALDKEIKRFLRQRENGRQLPLDILAHFEFFFNTLLMSHETSNPFKKPSAFPALNFPFISGSLAKPGEELSILDMHRHLIHPLEFNPR